MIERDVSLDMGDAELAQRLIELMQPVQGEVRGKTLYRVCQERELEYDRVRYRLSKAGLLDKVMAAQFAPLGMVA